MTTNFESLVLACDIDDTLVPANDKPPDERAAGLAALGRLVTLIEPIRSDAGTQFSFGSVTGRSLASHEECEEQVTDFRAAVQLMDFKVTSVGTESHIRGPRGFERVSDWPWSADWNPLAIRTALSELPNITLQPDAGQGDYKVSFNVEGSAADRDHDVVVGKITEYLTGLKLAASVIFSGRTYLDILPQGVNKGAGLLHTIGKLAMPDSFIIAAGDSMNDMDLLRVADLAILPSNAHAALKNWAQMSIQPQRLYIARQAFAGGVHEGVEWLLNR